MTSIDAKPLWGNSTTVFGVNKSTNPCQKQRISPDIENKINNSYQHDTKSSMTRSAIGLSGSTTISSSGIVDKLSPTSTGAGETLLASDPIFSSTSVSHDQIKKQTTWYFEIKDSQLYDEFHTFFATKHISYFFKFAIFIITFFLTPLSIYNLIQILMSQLSSFPSIFQYYGQIVFQCMITLNFICLAIIGWRIFSNQSQLIRVAFLYTRIWLLKLTQWISQWRPHSETASREMSRSLEHMEMSIRELSCQGSPSTGSLHHQTSAILKTSRIAPQPQFFAALPIQSSPDTPLRSPSKQVLEEIKQTDSLFNKRWNINHIQASFAILIQTLLLLSIFRNVVLNTCNISNQHNITILNSSLIGIHDIICDYPDFYLICVIFWLFSLPYFMFTALTGISIAWIWIIYGTTVLCSLGLLFMLSQFQIIPLLMLIVIWFVVMVIDLQLHKIHVFLTTQKITEALEKHEQMAVMNNAQEMRHMIANVAHDLKTPLASFVTGVDYIQLSIDECEQTLQSAAINDLSVVSSNLSTNFDSIQSCIKSIRNTNTFMMMTINRCLDYTKASKGLKLVPKHETMNLLETLQLPLDCMRNMQNRIAISIDSISDSVCSYVITDKQWFQENLLCLLSNAVKYSAEGCVDIRLSLKQYFTRPVEPYQWRDEDDTSTGSGAKRASGDAAACASDQGHTQPRQLMPFLLVEVEDMGIGMSEEAMASLFNPFKQTQRLAGGTGLGLYSLAKRLEALHGFYGVMKRRDGKQGSLFWFAIPYKPDILYAQHMKKKLQSFDAGEIVEEGVSEKNSMEVKSYISDNATANSSLVDQHEQTQTQSPPPIVTLPGVSTPADNQSGYNILLVDDSPTIIKMSSLMLKRLGHSVTVAENGAIAVKLVSESFQSGDCSPNYHRLFDIIFMDLQMPVMDGFEATKRIRVIEHDAYSSFKKKLTIIGMSANSDYETSEAIIKAGADSFLSKPFNVETIKLFFSELST